MVARHQTRRPGDLFNRVPRVAASWRCRACIRLRVPQECPFSQHVDVAGDGYNRESSSGRRRQGQSCSTDAAACPARASCSTTSSSRCLIALLLLDGSHEHLLNSGTDCCLVSSPAHCPRDGFNDTSLRTHGTTRTGTRSSASDDGGGPSPSAARGTRTVLPASDGGWLPDHLLAAAHRWQAEASKSDLDMLARYGLLAYEWGKTPKYSVTPEGIALLRGPEGRASRSSRTSRERSDPLSR